MPAIKFDHSQNDEFEKIFAPDGKGNSISPLNQRVILREKGTIQPKVQIQRKKKDTPMATLDLHGFTKREAISKTENFLQRRKSENLKQVLLITGKGMNSGDDGPVLKNALKDWLERDPLNVVAKFKPAPPKLGGGGAFLVELK